MARLASSTRRPSGESGTHGVYRLDPASGELELVFDHPDYHDIQAKLLQPRPRPDGRSSVVNEQDATGQLYGLNVSISDFEEPSWMKLGIAKRLRVLEGIPRKAADWNGSESCLDVVPPLAQKRILGDIPIEKDGSFYVKVPSDSIPTVRFMQCHLSIERNYIEKIWFDDFSLTKVQP